MDCLHIVRQLSPQDSDRLMERLDALQAKGMSPQAAQRAAAVHLLTSIQQERNAAHKALADKSPPIHRKNLNDEHANPQLQRDLQQFLDSDPDPSAASTPEQISAAKRAAAHALLDLDAQSRLHIPDLPAPARGDQRGSARSSPILSELARRHATPLVGATVHDARDLATISQLYRHPAFETLRLFFTDAEGRIVSQIGVTSRLPGSSVATIGELDTYISTLAKAAKEKGAAGMWMLHNHPSGNATVSQSDINTTREFAKAASRHGLPLAGHVVIDTNQYSHIQPSGDTTLHHADFSDAAIYSTPEWDAEQITSPEDAMRVTKRLAIDAGSVTVLVMDTQLKVKAISTIPSALALSGDKVKLRRALLRATLSNNGSRIIALSPNKDALIHFDGLALDAIWTPPDAHYESLLHTGLMWNSDRMLMPEPAERGARVTADTSPEFMGLARTAQELKRSRSGDTSTQVSEPTTKPLTLRPWTQLHYLQMGIQNRRNRWLHAVEDIKAQGGLVDDRNNFHLAEERSYGIAARQLEDFEKQVKQWAADVAADGLTLQDVALWAEAEYAPHRNTQIAAKRPGVTNGSGLTDKEAADIITNFTQQGKAALLAKHAQTLRDWVQGTREHLWVNGLISDDTAQEWSKDALYVPLRGLPDAKAQAKERARKSYSAGRSMDIRGKEAKEARGRRSRAKFIIEEIVNDRAKAIDRVAKNDIMRAFGQFVYQNPAPNLWRFDAVESKPMIAWDDQGNRIIEDRIVPIKDSRTIAFKDGGKQIHIEIKDPELLAQFKGLDEEQIHRAMHFALAANRAVSQLYTSLSPEFALLTNPIRDVQESAINMTGRVGFKGAAKYLGNYPRALAQTMAAEFGYKSKAYDTWERSGGKVAFMGFRTNEDRAKDLMRTVKLAQAGKVHPSKIAHLAYELTLGLVYRMGGGFENAPRFAAASTLKAMGYSDAEAISAGKNVTPNFNRRGAWRWMSAMWFFFNAQVQGIATVAQSLKSPKVQALVGTMAASVAASVPFMVAVGGKDDDDEYFWDKVPKFDKARNFIIMLPPGFDGGESIPGTKRGRYIKIPMSMGFQPFFATSYALADALRNKVDPARGISAADALGLTLSSFAQAFVAIGNTASPAADWVASKLPGGSPLPDGSGTRAAVALLPSLFKPALNVMFGTDSFGSPLKDKYKSPALPDSSRELPYHHGTPYDLAAKGLNSITGGNAYKAGLLDFSAGELKELSLGYGGGIANMMQAMADAALIQMQVKREDLRDEKIPFLRRLYGEVNMWTVDEDAKADIKQAKAAQEVLKAAKKGGASDAELESLISGFGVAGQLGAQIQAARAKLSRISKKEQAILKDGDPQSRYSELKALAIERRLVYQKINEAFGIAEKEQASKSSLK